MQFRIENEPETLSDLVFADKDTEDQFLFRASIATAGNILLYGPHGSGKSQALKVLAKTLLTPEFETDMREVNVSERSTKANLCSAVRDFGGFAMFNPLGKVIILLEEIDGAEKAAQKALKGIMDDMQNRAIFFATTNDLDNVIEPIQDRFQPKIYFPHASADAWASRASYILRRAGINLPSNKVAGVIRAYSSGGSARAILDGLERYVHEVNLDKAAAVRGAA